MAIEQAADMCEDPSRGLEFAFPNDQHLPPGRPQRILHTRIPLKIFLEFSLPELHAGFGGGRESATFMPMPEASMDKYTGPESREYNVGASREVPAMKPKSVTVGMEQPSYHELWPGITPLDACHHARAGSFVNDIHSSPFTAA